MNLHESSFTIPFFEWTLDVISCGYNLNEQYKWNIINQIYKLHNTVFNKSTRKHSLNCREQELTDSFQTARNLKVKRWKQSTKSSIVLPQMIVRMLMLRMSIMRDRTWTSYLQESTFRESFHHKYLGVRWVFAFELQFLFR